MSVGIDAEIAGAIADKLGLELVIDDMDFDAALLAVQQGKSDMLHGRPVRHRGPRLLVMDFSDSYATGIQVVIVHGGLRRHSGQPGRAAHRHPAGHHRLHLLHRTTTARTM